MEARLSGPLLRVLLPAGSSGELPQAGPISLGPVEPVIADDRLGRRDLIRLAWDRARSRPQGGLLPDATIPALTATRRHFAISPQAASAISAACGTQYDGRDLPPTVPEALFLPMLTRIVLHPAFPLSPLGLIHIGQRITSPRPLRSTDRPDLVAWVSGARASDRGITITLAMSAEVDGERVWSGQADLLSRSTAAQKPGGRARAPKPVPAGQGIPFDAPASAGLQYARATGDWSPHHLWPSTARMLGYRRPIAHGIWTLARVLSLMEDQLERTAPLDVDVRFKVPLYLPSRPTLLVTAATGTPPRAGIRLLDPDTGSPHLTGTVGQPAE